MLISWCACIHVYTDSIKHSTLLILNNDVLNDFTCVHLHVCMFINNLLSYKIKSEDL